MSEQSVPKMAAYDHYPETDLYEYLLQSCPGALEQTQVALAEIVYRRGGDIEDLTALEKVFVNGQTADAEETGQVLAWMRDQAQTAGAERSVDTWEENVLVLRLGEGAHSLVEIAGWLSDDIGGEKGVETVFTAQARALVRLAAVVEKVGSESDVEAAPPIYHQASEELSDLVQHGLLQHYSLPAEQFGNAVGRVAAYVVEGGVIDTKYLSVETVKAALKRLAGKGLVGPERNPDALSRYRALNACLPSRRTAGSEHGVAKLLPIAPLPGWSLSAKCLDADPETFFPEKGGSTREAKKICEACPVVSKCLDYALENDERFGIWGGKSERERRRMRREVKQGLSK